MNRSMGAARYDQSSTWVSSARIQAEIAYLDSPSDYRECIARRTAKRFVRPNARTAGQFTTLDKPARVTWLVICAVTIVGVAIALMFLR